MWINLRGAAKLAALQMFSWSTHMHADRSLGRCKTHDWACWWFRGGTEAVHSSIHPLPPPRPPERLNDHGPQCIAVLCNSSSSSFPAPVYVALKAAFMKVSVFLMSAPFDNSLSAELAGRVTVRRGALRKWYQRPFFPAHFALAFVYLLFTCMPLW